MAIGIDAILASKVGFASHQNAVPVIRELKLKSEASQPIEHCELRLTADPQFLHGKKWLIDRLSPGDELVIDDRDVQLNASLLSGLTESVTGVARLSLTSAAGEELASYTAEIELLAHNEWGGVGSMAELLPAFVMPNDPAVDRVLKAASETLRRAGKPGDLDGYKGQERTRVWQMAAAIWSAITGLRISYALPPASFERAGQKIRTPGAILEGRVATCLDTALLFAAALEQAGLNPLLILTKGHAFAGVWLQPVEFANLITDEAAALRRRFDLDDLVIFETTLATNDPPASFSEAMAAARRQVAEELDGSFEMAIDIRRARMQRIRPLGVAVAPSAAAGEAVGHSEGLEEAPQLPAFDVEIEEKPASPADRIRQWQRKLLNLTTSNRLLHVPDTAKVLRLLCPDPGALEDLLATGKKVRIAPMPELEAGGRDPALYERQNQTSLKDEVARQTLQRGEALALLGKDKLDAALVELYRKARTDLEEGGANTLFLALGFLKWKKSAADEKSYRAPLILLPVRLERKSALSGVTMMHHEDEPRFNLTLLELLRQDFDLSIPGLDGELPTDDHGVDVTGIWRTVRNAVKDMAGFEVVPDVVLGTFSFAKYLMWKDLVDRADRLKESPLVRHLIEREGENFADRADFPTPDELDQVVDPADLFTPLPADSSQLAAVVASARGHSFVLDGPPGCGKSQTIANMIAHNLALGRRVLFVAEKKAALDVVQRRLADKGLAPFCLELHSSKATKAAVLKQLDQAWTTRDLLTPEEWGREAAEARSLRDELNELVRLLHRREPNGWTIQRAIGLVVRDGAENAPRLKFEPGARHDEVRIRLFRDIVRRLGLARRDVDDLPRDLDGVDARDWSNAWQENICAAAAAIPNALDEVEAAGDALRAAMSIPAAANNRVALGRFLELARVALDAFGKDLRFAFSPAFNEHVTAVRQGLELIAEYEREVARLSAQYAPEAARRIDAVTVQASWSAAKEKLWPFSSFAKRRISRALAQAGGAAGPVDPDFDLPILALLRDLLHRLDALAPQASAVAGWASLATDRDRMETGLSLAEHLRSAIAAQAESPEELADLRRGISALVLDANELLSSDGRVSLSAARLGRALDEFDASASRLEELCQTGGNADFDGLRKRAGAVVTHGRRLRDWANWRRVRSEAIQANLGAIVDGLESGSISPSDASARFELGYAHWFAFNRMDEEPLLKAFAANEQADRIERFRQVDDRLGELASRYIRARVCGLIPDKNDAARKDGYGVLKRQLQLQRGHKPIRKLAAEMGDAFTRLAPCMLMSPLSIAQYLPADQKLFDLVIFDEASQITPWDAIGAMARGKQVVIAGDPRQMPPSNDFQRGPGAGTDGDSTDTEPDLDSILEECLAAGVPQHSLDWHYRSRHESLIAFSNHRYYDSRLVTFPAPETRASAVSWERVPGVWARGAERTNQVEAKAIVDEAVRRLRDPKFVDAMGRPLTLGIITMNIEQMRLVEDLLDRARRAHPDIEPHFSDDRLEPVVVRNLETAQGDERDVILLGVGFGPTEPGGKSMSMHMGKLNSQGGWRRLNVAVTRARSEMKIFTSFEPGMIDLTRTSQQAIADLKHFVEYAHRGPRAIAEADRGSLGGADSPFEEAVTFELRKRGWRIVPQVGVSRFRIDLGVVHPDRPGDYLAGVECDGASYHSAATARDRDKVRAAILEGLGWKLLRIWSTDWWTNKERAAERLHDELNIVLERDRQARAAGELELADTPAQPEQTVPDLIAEPIIEPSVEPEVLTAAVLDVPEGIPERPPLTIEEPTYARMASAPPPVDLAADGRYRLARFSGFADRIKSDQFYERSYDATIAAMIEHVLRTEAPITETQLVQRIARAHAFQRAGRLIRDRVLKIAKLKHHVSAEGGPEPFVWLDAASHQSIVPARYPAGEEDIRQIEEISLSELRGSRSNDPTEIARNFGVRRLSAAARSRIELALSS